MGKIVLIMAGVVAVGIVLWGVLVRCQRQRLALSRFMLKTANDECMFSLGTFEDRLDEARVRRLDAQGGGISRLNSVLSLVPSVLLSREVASGKYMEVLINGPLVSAKSGDGYRAFSMGEKGIQENAILRDPTALSRMANGALLFQVVSMIVAQKHLADISEKLDILVDEVKRISAFQEDQRKARLRAALKHLQDAAPAVLHGELSDALRHSLEAHEVSLLEIQDHIEQQLSEAVEEIAHLKDPNMFGAEGLVAVIEAHHRRIDGLINQWLLCLRARCMAWFLLSAFPEEIELKKSRLTSIKQSIQAFMADQGPLAHAHRALNVKIAAVDALFNWQPTIDGYKARLRQMTSESLALNQSRLATEQSYVASGDMFLMEQNEPLRLVIRIEFGKIAEAFQL
jgi:hypothetical protein